jgi:hypothetical protein
MVEYRFLGLAIVRTVQGAEIKTEMDASHPFMLVVGTTFLRFGTALREYLVHFLGTGKEFEV